MKSHTAIWGLVLSYCAAAFAGTITTTLNGLDISIDETHGDIVKLSYPQVGTILEASADAAGLLDLAYPIKEFVPLRLGSRYSVAKVVREKEEVTISWEKLSASRGNFTLPEGNVSAEVSIRAA